MIPTLPHVSSRIFNTPLLVDAGKLQTILGVLSQRTGLEIQGPLPVEAGSGLALQGSRNKVESDRISVIQVHGSLVYRSMGLSPQSGMRSYEDIREDFRAALEDGNTVGILFDIDSPGGEVSGVFDLVDEIYQARGIKPIYAVANEAALSAAYAIASAADEVFVPRTGWVGSIGVIAVHVDQSGFDHNMGIRYEPITAGSQKAAFDPHSNRLSPEARQWLQNSVNETYGMFVEMVARNRGLETKAVMGTEARVYQGLNAVQVGLADAVMSIGQVIAKLERKGGARMITPKIDIKVSEEEKPVLGAGEQEPQAPGEENAETMAVPDEEREQAKAGARAIQVDEAAINAERERVAGIMKICRTFGAWLPKGMEEKLIENGTGLDKAREMVLDAMAEAQEKSGVIRSGVDPMITGEPNPVVAEAERRSRGVNSKA